MRKIVLDISLRPRPLVTTPPKGGEGDCTDETMVRLTDLGSIVQRYAGNLAELAAWRGTMSYGEQPPNNLEDAIDKLKDAHDLLVESPYDSLEAAIDAINNGTFCKHKEETKNEAHEGKHSAVEENLQKDGQQAASEEH